MTRYFGACALAAVTAFNTSSASATVLGLDVYSGQGSINWSTVKNSTSYQFAWAKMTEGFTFDDTAAATHMTNAKAAGFLLGGYHFARPENNIAADEAAHVLSRGTAINAFLKDGLHLLPMLDLESGSGAHKGSSSLAEWAITWAKAMQTGLGTTKKLPLYVNGQYMAYLDDDATNFAKLPNYFEMWFAKPGSSQPTASQVSPFASWSLWQYSWTGAVTGIAGGAVDKDQFAGSLAQFQSIYVIPEPTSLAAIGVVGSLATRRRRQPDA